MSKTSHGRPADGGATWWISVIETPTYFVGGSSKTEVSVAGSISGISCTMNNIIRNMGVILDVDIHNIIVAGW